MNESQRVRLIFTGLMLVIFLAMDGMAATYPYKGGAVYAGTKGAVRLRLLIVSFTSC